MENARSPLRRRTIKVLLVAAALLTTYVVYKAAPIAQKIWKAWEDARNLPASGDEALVTIWRLLPEESRQAIEAHRLACARLLGRHLWPGRTFIAGNNGTMLYKGCLRCPNLPSSTYLEKIPAFEEMQQLLTPHGIRLIVMVVPSAYGIHPEWIPGLAPDTMPGPGATHPQIKAFASELQSKGIEFSEVSDDLRRAALKGSVCYFHRDSHWTPVAAQVAAEKGAGLLKGMPFPDPPTSYKASDVVIYELAFDAKREVGQAPPQLQIRSIDGSTASEESPVVVLADSNGLEVYDPVLNDPDQIQAGFASQLAFNLGQPVDLIYQTGGGPYSCRANFTRRCNSQPGYLQSKKVVIWLLAERALALPLDAWPPLGLKQLSPPKEPPHSTEPPDYSGRRVVRLTKASRNIEPSDTPYANVTRTFAAEVVPQDGSTPQTLILRLDHIRDRQLVGTSGLQAGTVLSVEMEPFDRAKSSHSHLETSQQLDDIENFLDPVYYADFKTMSVVVEGP